MCSVRSRLRGEEWYRAKVQTAESLLHGRNRAARDRPILFGRLGSFRKTVFGCGLYSAIASFFVFVPAYVLAYLSPDKVLRADINRYNEANFEMALIMLGAPCFFYFVYVLLTRMDRLWGGV